MKHIRILPTGRLVGSKSKLEGEWITCRECCGEGVVVYKACAVGGYWDVECPVCSGEGVVWVDNPNMDLVD